MQREPTQELFWGNHVPPREGFLIGSPRGGSAAEHSPTPENLSNSFKKLIKNIQFIERIKGNLNFSEKFLKFYLSFPENLGENAPAT